MAITYTGKVFWANAVPVKDVEVRLFNIKKDGSPGSELSMTPGISDSEGVFTLALRDSRLIDGNLLSSLDELSLQFDEIQPNSISLGEDQRPCLQFKYPIHGQPIQVFLPFRRLHRGYRLPHHQPVNFQPSLHGFVFQNNFKPFDPPISLPDFLGVNRVLSSYGLCGGMSSAAYNYCLAKTSDPKAPDIRQYKTVPKTATRLHRYLLRRALDTFGPAGKMIGIVGEWTLLPDDGPAGTRKLTRDGAKSILKLLQEGQCVVLTLIYERAMNLNELASEIWLNHQVLAYRSKEVDPDIVEISIYDSNFPDRDDAVIRAQQVQVGNDGPQPVYGFLSHEIIPSARFNKEVRGFFPMFYQPARPPGK
jgi:hypothetical protein